MKSILLSLLLLVALPAICAAGEEELIQYESIDLEKTLPGNAYFLSVGPSAPAQVESELGLTQGHKALRVTLFRCERSQSMWVEEMFINRAGGAHVIWGVTIDEWKLGTAFPEMALLSGENFQWVDATTFEFRDDSPWIDAEEARMREESRWVRFQRVAEGAFAVRTGAGD